MKVRLSFKTKPDNESKTRRNVDFVRCIYHNTFRTDNALQESKHSFDEIGEAGSTIVDVTESDKLVTLGEFFIVDVLFDPKGSDSINTPEDIIILKNVRQLISKFRCTSMRNALGTQVDVLLERVANEGDYLPEAVDDAKHDLRLLVQLNM